MMQLWQKQLNHNPIPSLLNSKDSAIIYFTKRDLLDEKVGLIEEEIWTLPEPVKMLKKQHPKGYWPSSNKSQKTYPQINYKLIETWKQFRILVDKYELNKKHPAIKKAAEYLFTRQTKKGDIRGILANQHIMYYHGAILSLLNKAGYQDDPRMEKGIKWLLKMRQDDGGWVATPFMATDLAAKEQQKLATESKEPLRKYDKSKPYSHNWTGMAIRALATHKKYRKSKEAKLAAELLKSKFFQKDVYPWYQHPDNWVRFQFPFWWNNLVSALDSIPLIGISKDDPDVRKALGWLKKKQLRNGLWKISYSNIHKTSSNKKYYKDQLWITLAICRIFKRFYK